MNSWRCAAFAVFVAAIVAVCGHNRAAAESTLPVYNVSALAVHDGRLFVGLFDDGLMEVQNDGTVRRAEPSLDPNVNALAVDSYAQVLWVGTARGLYRCGTRGLTCSRLPGTDAVHTLLMLHDGTLLSGGDAGLLAISRTGVLERLDKKRGAPFRAVWSLAEADDGTVFVGASNGVHFASRAQWFNERGQRRRVAMVTGDLCDDWVTALAFGDGVLHVGTYHGGLAAFRHDQGALVLQAKESALGYVNPAGIVLLPGGAVAVATMSGLKVHARDAWRAVQTADRDVTAIAPAGAGAYWVGTRTGFARVTLGAEIAADRQK